MRKRLVPLLIFLALALSGTSAWAEKTDDALPAGRLLLINDAVYDPGSGLLTITWTNTGSSAISGAEIRINPLDAAGEPMMISEGLVEEILLEERVLHTSAIAEPGKTVTVTFVPGGEYPAAAGMEIAVERIEKATIDKDGNIEDRRTDELPDDRLCWYSTVQNEYVSGPENGEPYTAPGEEVFTRAAGVHIGITTITVPGEVAAAYGFMTGGILVVAVEKDSPADHIGLEPGDLIFSVNDTDYEEEPYMMTLSAADLAEGKPVTLMLERENELWELTLTVSDQ